MSDHTDNLGTLIADLTMRGAAEYLGSARVKLDDSQLDALCASLRTVALATMDRAFADHKDARAARMNQVAEASFRASFRLAGIQAAKDHCVAQGLVSL